MGLDLVALALHERNRKALSPKAFAVLVAMARTALDKPNGKGQTAGIYFAGWQPLAIVLDLNPEDSASYELVARPLRELKRKGSIRPLVDHPGTGKRQSYELTLGPICPTETVGADPDALAPPNRGGAAPTKPWGSAPTKPVELPPPNRGALGEQGPTEGLTPGPTPPAAASTTDRARAGPTPRDTDGHTIANHAAAARAAIRQHRQDPTA